MDDYDEKELSYDPESDPSLNTVVIKERKTLLDAAFEGDKKAQKILKEQYGLTLIYRKGKTIILED